MPRRRPLWLYSVRLQPLSLQPGDRVEASSWLSGASAGSGLRFISESRLHWKLHDPEAGEISLPKLLSRVYLVPPSEPNV